MNQRGRMIVALGFTLAALALLFAVGCRAPTEVNVVDESSGSPVESPTGEPAPADQSQVGGARRAPLELLVELPRVGGALGSPAAQQCGGESVVVGIHGGAGQLIDSIAPICAELGDDAPLDDDVEMDRVGGSGGTPYRQRCAPGSVVVGIRGGAGDLVDRVAIGCLPMEAALDPSSRAEPVYNEGVGGDGGRDCEARCPPGSAVGGWRVAAARVLDSLTLECVASAGSAADPSAFVFTMADPPPEDFNGTLNVSTSYPGVLLVDGEEITPEGQDHTVELMEGQYEVQVVFPDGVVSDVRTVNIRPYVLTRVFFRRPEAAGP